VKTNARKLLHGIVESRPQNETTMRYIM